MSENHIVSTSLSEENKAAALSSVKGRLGRGISAAMNVKNNNWREM